MTAHNDLDRQLNDFLRDGTTELPYESFDVVRDRTDQTRQRVVIGPWRFPEMNKIVTIGLGAAAVVAVLFVGAQLFGSPTGGFGSQTTPSPEPTATLEPSPTPSSASAPPLTESFTSTLHGFSASYPEGWTAQAATEPWTDGTFPLNFLIPQIDLLYDPTLTSDLFLTMASQPIGEATPEEWVDDQMGSEEGCAAAGPIDVDGATGLIGQDSCDVAVVTMAGRGYWIQLYTSNDDLLAVAPYDRAWFEEVLATVRLHPEDAIEAGSSPSP